MEWFEYDRNEYEEQQFAPQNHYQQQHQQIQQFQHAHQLVGAKAGVGMAVSEYSQALEGGEGEAASFSMMQQQRQHMDPGGDSHFQSSTVQSDVHYQQPSSRSKNPSGFPVAQQHHQHQYQYQHQHRHQQHPQQHRPGDYIMHQQVEVNMNIPNMGLPNMSPGANHFVQQQLSQQQRPTQMSHNQPHQHQGMSTHNSLVQGQPNLFVPLSGMRNSGIRGMAVPGSKSHDFAHAPLPFRGGSEASMAMNLQFDSMSKMEKVAQSVPIQEATDPDGQVLDSGMSSDPKGARKGGKRSNSITLERMERHKILERKRREKTKELMSELKNMIPNMSEDADGLTMNKVLEEAIEHIKKQNDSTALVTADAGVKKEDGAEKEGGGGAGLSMAFGENGMGVRDGFSVMSEEGSNQPSTGLIQSSSQDSSLQPKDLSINAINFRTLPEQDIKYIRLLLMQETLYAKMLDAWERKWGVEIVRLTMSSLAMSKRGLKMEEIRDIVDIQSEGQSKVWEEMYAALNADLAVRSEGLLGFVYSAFRLAIERRYLHSKECQKATQKRLADYFEKKGKSLAEDDRKRVNTELPYALEELGEWSRLRDCLSNSLEVMSQMYDNDNAQDLLRFWRSGNDEIGTYQVASETLKENLVKFEREGMDPEMLWQSSLITARFLGDAGQFEEADTILSKARDISKGIAGCTLFLAEVSMRCAELLNKWAASSPKYSVQMVEQSAFFAFEAADIYAAALQEQGPQALTNTIYDYATALYWMSLNFATLCRLGGGSTWNAEQAKRIAEEALEKCMKERKDQGAPDAKMADTLFAQSVLDFCFAEAYANGVIRKESNGKEGSASDSESSEALYQKSYALLKDVNERYRKALGGKHLESIKCLTMLSLIARKTGMIKEAIEWCKLEVAMRQELQGDAHPRTQQAQRVYLEIVEEGTKSSAGKRKLIELSSTD